MPASEHVEATTFRATVLEAFHFDHVAFPLILAISRCGKGALRVSVALFAATLTIWLLCWLRTWVRVEVNGTVSGRHNGKRFEVLPSRIQTVQWWSKWGMRQAWLRTTTGETFALPASIVRDPAFQRCFPIEVTRHHDPKEADRQASIAGIAILVTVLIPLLGLMLWMLFN